MPNDALGTPRNAPVLRRQPAIPNGVLGMVIFIVTEVMFFSGLISAFMIVKAGTVGGWPPVGQPRLPAEETMINTGALIVSAILLFLANQAFRKGHGRAKPLLAASIALGAFFVAFQGAEWVAMLRQGLTLTSSTHGSFFYLIVGVHGLHAVVALGVLAFTYVRLRRDDLSPYTFWACAAVLVFRCSDVADFVLASVFLMARWLPAIVVLLTPKLGTCLSALHRGA